MQPFVFYSSFFIKILPANTGIFIYFSGLNARNSGELQMAFIKKTGLFCLLLTFSLTAQAEKYTSGKHYDQLDTPVVTQTGDKIEVLEFFWYGCPHCFSFEPTLKKWKKTLPDNVQFIRMPSPLNPRWMVHTKTYYTLESMGEIEKHHEAIFSAMHVKKQRLFTRDSIAEFLEGRGVDKASFLANFDSFAVEMRARQALQLGQQYKLSGVPMLTVNGKYVISADKAGSYQGMVDIANFLIKKEN